ncbi:MAG: M14 family metallopeptidase [Pseudomonadota bacterium]|nr:M14 family metallopeptidase [Pseudomonadota bacterium]
MLDIVDHMPPGLLEAAPDRLHDVLAGPTLIHLPGRREPPLFVSVLLHGDETTGFEAVQALLRRQEALPRALSLFIGNVAAARHRRRRLDGQPDYNRIWAAGDSPEHAMARRVLDEMRRRRPFASVDLHNNSGLNPYYTCISRLDPRFLHLAALFSRTTVYFSNPDNVLSCAFAALCPAVTAECGQAGAKHSLRQAVTFLDGCLHLAEFPDQPPPPQDLELLHTVAIVRVPAAVSFGFGDCGRDLCFSPHLDHLNFRELPAGTPLARVRDGLALPLEVVDQAGAAVAERFVALRDGEIRLLRPVIPAMFSTNERAIRLDCLGYLMERLAAADDAPAGAARQAVLP